MPRRPTGSSVDESIEARLVWDKAVHGDVVFTGQRFAIRNLNLSQLVALLHERRRRLDAGEDSEAVEAFLEGHGYLLTPFSKTRNA